MPLPYYTPQNLDSLKNKFDTIAIKPIWINETDQFVAKMIANKSVYQQIQAATNVPWYFIACLHMRESGMDFTKHLHNGDPLTAKTKQVPANRPPFPPANGKVYSFYESAVDSLRYQQLDKWKDWSLQGMLYKMELYNGPGYIKFGRDNPYLFSGTQHYSSGKYVADGKFSNTAVDKQVGAATLLKRFFQLYPEYATGVIEKKKLQTLKTIRNNIATVGSSFWDFFTGK